MIAREINSVFAGLVRDAQTLGRADMLNPDPQPYAAGDEGLAGHAYLDPQAMPDDPSHMAVIGVIDDAVPFAHEGFRTGPGGRMSRAAAVWLQDVVPVPGGPGADLPFGRELRGSGISDLLAQLGSVDVPDEDALYRAAGWLDFARPVLPTAAYIAGHGAAVAGLAAGFAPGDAAGRDHPLIAVSLPAEIVRDTMGTFAPFYILAGTLFILHRARRMARGIEAAKGLAANSLHPPVVINISYGVTAGPPDGQHLIARMQDALSAANLPGLGPVHFVLPSGNHRLARLHGAVTAGQVVPWRLKPDDKTLSSIEFHGPLVPKRPKSPVAVTLRPPGAAAPVAVPIHNHNGWAQLTEVDATGQRREIARVYHALHRLSGGWREEVTVICPPTAGFDPTDDLAPSGVWEVGLDVPQGQHWQVGVQRDDVVPGFRRDGRQARIDDPAVPRFDAAGRPVLVEADPPVGVLRKRGSANAYATGDHQIRVGAVRADTGDLSPYVGLLAGLARDSGGDVLAVADAALGQRGIVVPGARSGGHLRMSGTSVAAPKMTRWLAGHLAANPGLRGRAAVVAALAAAHRGPGPDPVVPERASALAAF